MLESHTWYRDAGFPRALRVLLIANAVAFVLQSLTPQAGFWSPYLLLSWRGLQAGRLWQLVTYQFLHAHLPHLLLNMLALYSLGPETERAMGQRHFLTMYLLSGILGGLGFVLITPRGVCLGASGAVFGVIAAFATLFPRRSVSLLFFPFVAFQARTLALVFAAIELLYLARGVEGGIAHAAHLAGGISGAIYVWIVVRGFAVPRRLWPRRRMRPGGYDLAEVDRILDKVAREGIDRLTRRERAVLEAASRRHVPRG